MRIEEEQRIAAEEHRQAEEARELERGRQAEKKKIGEQRKQMEEERRWAAGVLGLPMHASKAEFRRAYKRAAMSWHPDKNVGNEAHAAEKFKELQDASVVLGLKF